MVDIEKLLRAGDMRTQKLFMMVPDKEKARAQDLLRGIIKITSIVTIWRIRREVFAEIEDLMGHSPENRATLGTLRDTLSGILEATQNEPEDAAESPVSGDCAGDETLTDGGQQQPESRYLRPLDPRPISEIFVRLDPAKTQGGQDDKIL